MSKKCTICKRAQENNPTETVIGIGTGWKCECGWWNWLKRETTVCTTMHCYNRAKVTGNPARPPFCNRCKRKSKKNLGKRRKSRLERRKIKIRTN